MKIDVTAVKWMRDADGMWIMAKGRPADIEAVVNEAQSPLYTLEIKPKSNRRSRNANSYLWELCSQMSEALSRNGAFVTKEDIYRQHIRDAGKSELVEVIADAADRLMQAWSGNGIGWFAERLDASDREGYCIVCLYYGSSSYDTREMSRLLDSIVQDAKSIGISCGSDRELSLLKEAWK